MAADGKDLLKMVFLKVFRFDPETDKDSRFDQFAVEAKAGMTVLEALFQVLEKMDGSLAFRYACRGAVCGSCAMHINGAYRLACQTQLSALKSDTVTVRPLAHLPIIRDLVVDMTSFFDKYEAIRPYLITLQNLPAKEFIQSPADRKKLDELIDCILCGCCYSSCTMTLTDQEYLGPAALLKANRFFRDSRDEGKEERLEMANSENGLWRCHTIFNCVESCPKNINPTWSISHLKGKVTREAITHPFRKNKP